MHKLTLFHKWVVVVLSAWLLLVPGLPRPAAAPIVPAPAVPVLDAAPLAQCTGTDLQIAAVTIEPDPPLTDEPYNVHVQIVNGGTVTATQSGATSWAVVSLGAPPGGGPTYQTEVPVDLDELTPGGTATAHLTIPGEQAPGGYHYMWVRIDSNNNVDENCSDGENNNLLGPITIAIPIELPPTPTLTPFPAPQIYFFQPGDVTVLRGSELTLRWQVYGDAVSVTLDGVPVPLEDTRTLVATESHVYTLRAQNPGGTVERVCRITVTDPTPTPCTLAVIHQFGATRTTISRGEETTLYWDLSGATEAYLNDQGVQGVSQRTVRLEQTTVFRLVAHNTCGDVERSLTIQVVFSTPTLTFTPTRTPVPTFTPTPTGTPTGTPTRYVLPTLTPTYSPPAGAGTATPNVTVPPTLGPQSPTITPGVLGTPDPLSSPLDPPTGTVVVETQMVATETPTLASTPTSTPTAIPELATVTPTPPWMAATKTHAALVGVTATAQAEDTATPLLTPTPTPTVVVPASAGGGTMLRLYLCPLGVLILFAVGVLVLSFVVPRIRERQQAELALSGQEPSFEPLSVEETGYEPLVDEAEFEPFTETLEFKASAEESPSAPLEIDDLLPDWKPKKNGDREPAEEQEQADDLSTH